MKMDMFGNRQPGSWSISSKLDTRWNFNGTAKDLVISSGLPGGCKECKNKINELIQLYGDPPEDLEVGCDKD